MNQIESSLVYTEQGGEGKFAHDTIGSVLVGRVIAEMINQGKLSIGQALLDYGKLFGIPSTPALPTFPKSRKIDTSISDIGKHVIELLEPQKVQSQISALFKPANQFPTGELLVLAEALMHLPNPKGIATEIRSTLECLLENPTEDFGYVRAAATALGYLIVPEAAPLLIKTIALEPNPYFRKEYLWMISFLGEEVYKEGFIAYYQPLMAFGKQRWDFLNGRASQPQEVKYESLTPFHTYRYPYIAANVIIDMLEMVEYDEEGMVVWRLVGDLVNTCANNVIKRDLFKYQDHEESHPIISRLLRMLNRYESEPIETPMFRAPASVIVRVLNADESLLGRLSSNLGPRGRWVLMDEWFEFTYRNRMVEPSEYERVRTLFKAPKRI